MPPMFGATKWGGGDIMRRPVLLSVLLGTALLAGSGLRAQQPAHDVIASRGGIPLIEDDKIIDAIGCSGGTASQDEATCMVGAALINK
jgi:uncharacterized protein GlcG (DUF336 family)